MAARNPRQLIRLLIEPINTFEIPGFYLSSTQQVLDILNDVGADNHIYSI